MKPALTRAEMLVEISTILAGVATLGEYERLSDVRERLFVGLPTGDVELRTALRAASLIYLGKALSEKYRDDYAAALVALEQIIEIEIARAMPADKPEVVG